MKRAEEEKKYKENQIGGLRNESPAFDSSFEGHGVLIVARETVYDKIPLCLGLGESKNKVSSLIFLLTKFCALLIHFLFSFFILSKRFVYIPVFMMMS